MRSARLARFFQAIAGHGWLIAALVVLGANILGLAAVFSDLGPSEPAWLRIVSIVGLFVFAGTVFGALLPRAWYLAVLTCIGPMAFGALALSVRLRVDGPPPYWTFILLTLSVPPMLALVSAYFGSGLRRNVEIAGSDAP